MSKTASPASFRDPDGFVFRGDDGVLYRQVHASSMDAYRLLMSSGLYARLAADGHLIEHEEVPLAQRFSDAAAAVLRPHELPVMSYPYEWCFSQLKDAALLTLTIQKQALGAGMSLKDCSAFNITFDGCRPVFFDTLSFDLYTEGAPWVAYRQFCQHFLAPLALMSYRDPRLVGLFRAHIDGIPLDLAATLLPRRTRLRLGLGLHIHAHASMQRRDAQRQKAGRNAPDVVRPGRRIGKNAMLGLIDSLESSVRALKPPAGVTEWSDYYDDCHYADAAAERKARVVRETAEAVRPRIAWDLGANTGHYSRIVAETGATVAAFDVDWLCVERNYAQGKTEKRSNLVPLWLDLTNPSPGLGWAHRERAALADRGPADLVLALALVHHIAIGNNVPFALIADYLAILSRHLVIEFVPKDDPQTLRLLETRKDIFAGYTQDAFESAFNRHFETRLAERLPESGRVLYWMSRR